MIKPSTIRTLIPVLSLLVALVGGVASFYSVRVADQQSKISAEQYEESKPRLKMELSAVTIFPIDKQEDHYQGRYRAYIYATLINQSSLPLTITNFQLSNKANTLIGWSIPHMTNNDTYITKRQWSGNGYIDDILDLKNGKQIKPLVVLPPYEAKSGVIFFQLEPSIQNIDKENVEISIFTSRKTFISNVAIELNPGLLNEE